MKSARWRGWLTASNQCTSFSACDVAFDHCANIGRGRVDLAKAARTEDLVPFVPVGFFRNDALAGSGFVSLCRGAGYVAKRRSASDLSVFE